MLEAFNLDYEEKQFGYTSSGRKVADYTLNLFLGWYLPKFLFPIARPFMYAAMDDHLLRTLRYPKPNLIIQFVTIGALKLRGFVLRFVPARKKPALRTTRKSASYPKGYKIDKLGSKKQQKN